MNGKSLFFLLLLLTVFSFNSKSQSGANDPTFNPTDVGFSFGDGASNYINTSALQSDGKILIGGYFTSYNGTIVNNIARINTDGALDTVFNTGTGTDSDVLTSALQSDGKILIGGYFTSINGTTINRIARLNADGTLDAGFNPGTGANSGVKTIVLQSDGKIIIGGYFTSYNGTARNYIARLNADGTLDTGFNPGTGANSGVKTIVLQSDGKIIIGGDFTSYNSTARNNIARLNADGTLDTGFNPGTGASGSIITSTLQSDGKIIIGGVFSFFNGAAKNRVARINADGTLDATFNPSTGANSSIMTTVLQSDGKIIIGGDFTAYNDSLRKYIARLNADGTLDASFNPGMGANYSVSTIVLQSDGKIIIGGSFTSYNGTTINRIARLNADGTLDTGFNPGTGASSTISTIVLQSDGKILIGGSFTSYNGTARNRIARLNADGTLDTGFNPGTGASGAVFTILLQNDGKIVIGGFFTSYNGTTRNYIARLNADGTLDTGFNPGTGANWTINKAVLQNDGKILIGGNFTSYNGTAINRIARLNADGTLDTGFNPGTGTNNVVITTVLQSDGKIIICGGFTSYNGIARNCIARLNADGTLDTEFNPGTGANSGLYASTLQSDGKIIIGGTFTSYNGTGRNRIARILNCVNKFNSINANACDSYTAPDGQVYTTSGIKTAIIPNMAGCDSTITINLTVNHGTASNINASACDSYTAPDGQVYTTSGIKTAIIPNAASCDSTITINLTINHGTASSINATACDSYTAPDGQVYTTSGIKAAIIPNAASCDSTITINLTVNHGTASSINASACDSYTAPDGQVYTTSGIKTAIIPNAASCDSTITINLTVNTLDDSVTVNDPVITAYASGASYVWVDCDNNYVPVSGETNQSFTANVNGNYAVIVTQGACSDTSVCTQITSVVMSAVQTKEVLSIYPNPATDELIIEIIGGKVKINFEILNTLGQIVFKGNFIEKATVQTCNFAPGVYFVKLENPTTAKAGEKVFECKKIIKE